MDYREEVLRNCPGFPMETLERKLSLGGLGVAGECGETAMAALDFAAEMLRLSAAGAAVADLLKKVPHHSTTLAVVREKLIKEMGDAYWYLEYLCATLGITREEVMAVNVAKLRARHPNGWTPESQSAKADEKVPS